MAFETLLDAMAEGIGPEEQADITGVDLALAQSELDPDQARYHPALYRSSDVESMIDGIYRVSVVPNPYQNYAALIVHAAAYGQVRDLGDAADAFLDPELLQPAEELVEEYERLSASQSSPIASHKEALDVLDRSCREIDIILANVPYGIYIDEVVN